MRVSKKFLGAKKVQQYSKIINTWTSSVSWSSIKRIVSEALAPIVSTLRHPMLKSASEAPSSYTSSYDHNSAPREDPLGSCISYIACIHLHSSVVKYLPCMVKNFDYTNTLLLTFKISVVKYRKVVRV